jgi:hypothetical protein
MSASKIDGDLLVTGNARFGSITLPDAAVGDVQASAASPLGRTKTVHQYDSGYAQPIASAVVDAAAVLHVAHDTGTVVSFQVGIVTPPIGAATIVVTLKKNGAVILSASITLNNATVAYAVTSGAFTVSPHTYVSGDVFSIDVDETTGGGTQGKGIFASLVVAEGAG